MNPQRIDEHDYWIGYDVDANGNCSPVYRITHTLNDES